MKEGQQQPVGDLLHQLKTQPRYLALSTHPVQNQIQHQELVILHNPLNMLRHFGVFWWCAKDDSYP